MSELRFDGRVAVVTGAGNGLGRSYALLFASRGAKVVVNDLGGGFKGDGGSHNAADKVVQEIKSKGGVAVANYDSVTDGDKIVKTAIDNFGRVDILVNNAGILRDVSFAKMSQKDWDLIFEVHMMGTMKTTKACWEHMIKQKYGRIINVSSAAGLYGNFGQANYSAAKMAIVGFTSTIAREGKSKNIIANCIAPLAASRMTETVMPKEMLDVLSPDYVAPFVAFLAHEEVDVTGKVFEVGAGWAAQIRWQRSKGAHTKFDKISPEGVKEIWARINDFDDEPTFPESGQDGIAAVMEAAADYAKQRKAKL